MSANALAAAAHEAAVGRGPGVNGLGKVREGEGEDGRAPTFRVGGVVVGSLGAWGGVNATRELVAMQVALPLCASALTSHERDARNQTK